MPLQSCAFSGEEHCRSAIMDLGNMATDGSCTACMELLVYMMENGVMREQGAGTHFLTGRNGRGWCVGHGARGSSCAHAGALGVAIPCNIMDLTG